MIFTINVLCSGCAGRFIHPGCQSLSHSTADAWCVSVCLCLLHFLTTAVVQLRDLVLGLMLAAWYQNPMFFTRWQMLLDGGLCSAFCTLNQYLRKLSLTHLWRIIFQLSHSTDILQLTSSSGSEMALFLPLQLDILHCKRPSIAVNFVLIHNSCIVYHAVCCVSTVTAKIIGTCSIFTYLRVICRKPGCIMVAQLVMSLS